MGICRVCEEEIETNKCTLPSCGHEFHTNCIVTWLCENYGKCCQREHDSQLRYQEYRNVAQSVRYRDFKYASSQARRKTAPSVLKTMYTKYVRLSAKYKEKREKVRAFRGERMVLYTTLRREYYKLRGELRKSYRNITSTRREICHHFPIPEDNTENIPAFTEMEMPSFCANMTVFIR
jgi:hypothetical protein